MESHRKDGATVRDIQRFIDERHYEELAIDTIEASLASLVNAGRLTQSEPDRWTVTAKTDKADALRRLFGE